LAFSALSRLQNDPVRHKSYFLKGYSLVNSLTFPCTILCALFADDLILVVLGPRWMEAAPIFRLLAPTILIFGIINPMWWLMGSTGRQGRSLAIALVIAPLVSGAYVIGLPYGPGGVALAFSAAMALWLVPHILWCIHGTTVAPMDIFLAISKPLASAVIAGALAFGAGQYLVDIQLPVLRLALKVAIMIAVYYWILLFIMGQKDLYLDLLRGLGSSASTRAE
jgi:PST family polysaccharide transporter